MKKTLGRLLMIGAFLGLLCLKPVSDRMPEPMKSAFGNVRQTAFAVASGEGIGIPDIRLPRGAWGKHVVERRGACRRPLTGQRMGGTLTSSVLQPPRATSGQVTKRLRSLLKQTRTSSRMAELQVTPSISALRSGLAAMKARLRSSGDQV